MQKKLHPAWAVALVGFVLAGATGSLLRFGMLHGYPLGLQMTNVRHAHSHLMYFGWVTPALMLLIISQLPDFGVRPHWQRANRTLISVFAAALLAYVSFLLSGYRPLVFESLTLPLSVIAAGINVLTWYLFVFEYARLTRGVRRHLPLRLWDLALALLVLSSLGAWGLALLTLAGVQSTLWSLVFTHLFLGLFADGWFLLALLGLAFSVFPRAAFTRAARLGEWMLLIALPLSFLLNVPSATATPGMRLVGGVSAGLAAIGIVLMVGVLSTRIWVSGQRFWVLPLMFLALKAIAQLLQAFPAGASWASGMALRVSYLHWMLLGFVTLGLLAAAKDRWGAGATPYLSWFAITVVLLLASLLPLTGLWPRVLSGRWMLPVAAWATLGPVLVASAMLLKLVAVRRVRRRTHGNVQEPRPDAATGR